MSELPLTYVKGIGPQRAEVLQAELKINSLKGLFLHLPFRYVDRTQFHRIAEITSDEEAVQIRGVLRTLGEVGTGRTRRLVGIFQDDSGQIELVWFKGIRWVMGALQVGASYVAYGKPTRFKNTWNIAHPEMEKAGAMEAPLVAGLQPVYSTTEKLSARGMNSRGIERIIKGVLNELPPLFPENLPHYLLDALNLMPRAQAMMEVHAPRDVASLKKARYRLKFEELFMIQVGLLRQKLINQRKLQGFTFSEVGEHFHGFYEKLPFALTDAQKRVLKEIRRDLRSGKHMNRLLQGDVGSGKTVVAVLSMLLAVDNGYQAALMAPTEILAQQHFQGIYEWLNPLGIRVELLTGSTRKAARRDIAESLESGELAILIGTHALLEDPVQFANLGLVVIDEQHRFGVAQRAKLWKKNKQPPHVLVMTATPIPRTLAMTAYGDLDVSTIDELPPGRKDIQTVHRFDNARARIFGFMAEEIAKGRQVYVVYPLIEESQAMDYKDLMDGYESIVRRFPMPDFNVSIVHGKMKAQDKDWEMQRFVKGETQIMVATTVIEVGVNVPNASVMVIESAERFGLSQLHQLRGRVGRGAEQSYCILMSGEDISADARERLATMCRTNNGFEIAEVDLRLRGPGNLMGTQQSGALNLAIADIVKDQELLQLARAKATQMLEADPELSLPENAPLSHFLKGKIKKIGWGRIS